MAFGGASSPAATGGGTKASNAKARHVLIMWALRGAPHTISPVDALCVAFAPQLRMKHGG